MKLYEFGELYKLGTRQFTLYFNKVSGMCTGIALQPQLEGKDVQVTVLLKSKQGAVVRYERGTVDSAGRIVAKKHITAEEFSGEITKVQRKVAKQEGHLFIRLFDTIHTLYYCVDQ